MSFSSKYAITDIRKEKRDSISMSIDEHEEGIYSRERKSWPLSYRVYIGTSNGFKRLVKLLSSINR